MYLIYNFVLFVVLSFCFFPYYLAKFALRVKTARQRQLRCTAEN